MSVVSQGTPIRALLVGTQNTGGIITGVASGAQGPSINCEGYSLISVYIKATAALSDGTVIIEVRDQPQDLPAVASTTTLATPFASAGGTAIVTLSPGAYAYVSARIGTTVVGGLVSVVLRAN